MHIWFHRMWDTSFGLDGFGGAAESYVMYLVIILQYGFRARELDRKLKLINTII